MLRTAFNVGYQRPLHLGKIVNCICETMGIPHPRKKIPSWPQIPNLMRLLPFGKATSLATRFELIAWSHYFEVSALSNEIGSDITEKDPVLAMLEALKG